MNTNGALRGKDKIKLIQKAVLTGIGAAISKDTIAKAAVTIYDDVQKEIKKLVNSLEEQGELKTKETKKLLKQIQVKSDLEKKKLYVEIQKTGNDLFKSIKDLIGFNKSQKTSRKSTKAQKSRVKKKRR